MGRKPNPLDAREQRYVELYCTPGTNQTNAALLAGFATTAKSASVRAVKLMRMPKIRRAIDERNAQLAAIYGIGPERIYREVATVAYMPVEKLEIRGNDKIKALEMLAKLSRMFPGDRVEVSGPGGGPIEHVVQADHKMDIEVLDHEQREALKQVLTALKAKQIEHQP